MTVTDTVTTTWIRFAIRLRLSATGLSRPDAGRGAIARTRTRAVTITDAVTLALVQAVLVQHLAVARTNESIAVAGFVALALTKARVFARASAVTVAVAGRVGAGLGARPRRSRAYIIFIISDYFIRGFTGF